jgi:hypothetical protein
MSPDRAKCKVCELGTEVTDEIQRRFAIGLPASDVVGYLGTLGHKVTQRQLVDHRRHVIALVSPRNSIVSDGVAVEVCDALPSMADADISDREREERMIAAFLHATDMMLKSLEQTGSIKISRAAVELGSLAHQMLVSKMTREIPLDPVVNVIMQRIRLEDVMDK